MRFCFQPRQHLFCILLYYIYTFLKTGLWWREGHASIYLPARSQPVSFYLIHRFLYSSILISCWHNPLFPLWVAVHANAPLASLSPSLLHYQTFIFMLFKKFSIDSYIHMMLYIYIYCNFTNDYENPLIISNWNILTWFKHQTTAPKLSPT